MGSHDWTLSASRAKHMMAECIEHATVANEEEKIARVWRHPLSNDRRNAVEYLLKGIGIRRKAISGRLIVLRF